MASTGSCNASTAAEHTVYHFDVSENRLEEALDRLTSFFVCPLFTESATEREISAVNNENARNVKTDSRHGRMARTP
jgi:insulysin